jgi:hypothetical protein
MLLEITSPIFAWALFASPLVALAILISEVFLIFSSLNNKNKELNNELENYEIETEGMRWG